MWGQVYGRFNDASITGIIPTRVGTSGPSYSAAALSRDHPHACGDKSNFNENPKIEQGSSPRVWGQDVSGANVQANTRIIPTRVGTRRFHITPRPH